MHFWLGSMFIPELHILFICENDQEMHVATSSVNTVERSTTNHQNFGINFHVEKQQTNISFIQAINSISVACLWQPFFSSDL